MIVAVDAVVAEGAMAAPWRPNYLAVGAEAAGLHRVEQLYEVERRVRLDPPRIAEPDTDAEEACEAEERLTAVEKPWR